MAGEWEAVTPANQSEEKMKTSVRKRKVQHCKINLKEEGTGAWEI